MTTQYHGAFLNWFDCVSGSWKKSEPIVIRKHAEEINELISLANDYVNGRQSCSGEIFIAMLLLASALKEKRIAYPDDNPRPFLSIQLGVISDIPQHQRPDPPLEESFFPWR